MPALVRLLSSRPLWLLVATLVVLSTGDAFLARLFWFEALGYDAVFRRILLLRVGLFAAAAVLAYAYAFLNLSSPGDDGARCGAALAVEGLDGLVDGDIEGVGVTERAVGQVVPLQVAPGALDVVQRGRVLRQPLDREPGPRGERPPARPARVDRAVVQDKDHRPILAARRRAVGPVEPHQQGDEIGGALGPAGADDQLAARVVEHAEERALARPARRLDPQVRPALRPAVGEVGVGQRLGLVPEQEVDVAGRRLLLQQPQAQAGAVHGVRVLPPLEGVPRPAPAVAPFRRTTLRGPGEIVSPVHAATSAASRARVQTGRSAAPPFSSSPATASAASRLRGVRPGRGRERSASTPPRRNAARQRRTCSSRTPRRPAIAGLVSPSSDQSTARARSASRRAAERPSRSTSAPPPRSRRGPPPLVRPQPALPFHRAPPADAGF